VLEWPPPGLEELQGAVARPLRRMVVGSLSIAAPLSLIAAVSRASGLRPGWPEVLVVPLIAGVGAVFVILGVVEGVRLLRAAVRAARAGYGWGIIGEVLADVGKDTGALIAGEREYAVLSVSDRNAIRRWRVQRAGLQLLSALTALSGFLIGLPIASLLGCVMATVHARALEGKR